MCAYAEDGKEPPIVVTVLVERLGSAAAVALLAHARGAVLGQPQRRALDTATRQAAEQAATRHPSIAQISADIDLLSDEAVGEEVVRRATGHVDVDWRATVDRWKLLYGTDPDDELAAFMADLAGELERRLRGNPELQPLFLVERSDVLIETQEAISSEVAALGERTGALVDPVKAVRFQGARVGRDLRLAAEIIGQVGAEISEGPLGQAANIHVSLTSTGSTFTLEPKPGADLRLTLQYRAADAAHGRDDVDAIRSAIEQGRDIDIQDAEVQLFANGVPIAFSGPVHASSRPVSTQHQAVIVFRARGLPPERFLVALDLSASLDGSVHGESRPDSPSPLRVEVSIAPGRKTGAKFRASKEGLTVRRQVKIARLSRHLARGCRVDLWFAELDISLSAVLPAQGGAADADYWARALALFEEVQLRVGVDVGQVEELTPLDVAYLRMAKRFLMSGSATFPGRGGSITMRTDTDLTAHVPTTAIRRGSVLLANAQPEMILPLSRHPLPLGPATFHYRARWPPAVTREADSYVTVVEVDPRRAIRIEQGARPSG